MCVCLFWSVDTSLRAQKDVLRFKEREKILQKVADLKKKLPWMAFEAARERALALKAELQAVEARVER